jgi:hypothetical protein
MGAHLFVVDRRVGVDGSSFIVNPNVNLKAVLF